MTFRQLFMIVTLVAGMLAILVAVNAHPAHTAVWIVAGLACLGCSFAAALPWDRWGGE